jgi:YVTN family beta-propeller protein
MAQSNARFALEGPEITFSNLDQWRLTHMKARILLSFFSFFCTVFVNTQAAVSYSVIGTIQMGTPHTSSVGINPTTNLIYGSGVFVVPVINGATNSTGGTVTTTISGLPQFLQGVDVNPLTNRIYVVDVGTPSLLVIDGATNTVMTTIPGLFFRSRMVGVNPVTNKIYVSNDGNGGGTTVQVIDGATNTIIKVISVGTGPNGVAINPGTNRIYIGNYISKTVSVIDGSSDSVIATILVGNQSIDIGLNPITNRIYVGNYVDNTVSVIDGATNTVIATVPVGLGPRGIGVNRNTNHIFVSNFLDNTVSVIDGGTNTVIDTVPVGANPVDVKVNPVTNLAYVANINDVFVSVIAADTPVYSCVGFDPPLNAGPVKVTKKRALPFKAQLLDAAGVPVTNSGIAAPPVLQVFFTPTTGGTPQDVTSSALPVGLGNEGNQFQFNVDKWQYNLKTTNYSAPGTYTASITSGDNYTINPSCQVSFVIE